MAKEGIYRNAQICQDPSLPLVSLVAWAATVVSFCYLYTWIYLGWTHLDPPTQSLSTGAEQSPGRQNKQRKLGGEQKSHRGPHGDKVGRGTQLILAHGDKELHVNGHLILLYCSNRRNLSLLWKTTVSNPSEPEGQARASVGSEPWYSGEACGCPVLY